MGEGNFLIVEISGDVVTSSKCTCSNPKCKHAPRVNKRGSAIVITYGGRPSGIGSRRRWLLFGKRLPLSFAG